MNVKFHMYSIAVIPLQQAIQEHVEGKNTDHCYLGTIELPIDGLTEDLVWNSVPEEFYKKAFEYHKPNDHSIQYIGQFEDHSCRWEGANETIAWTDFCFNETPEEIFIKKDNWLYGIIINRYNQKKN